ncbi:MAG: gliding motility lipoprotein GldH [Prevotella sp.]|nr:gliding motility lipoprotein GldH [Bacteroides sp.]MCM1366753.1 gliding motility lipoprotein GldH [Prevotella sp.]MCM1437372.1 gliding motility lipoprotein GldH [Prevotella sp.]
MIKHIITYLTFTLLLLASFACGNSNVVYSQFADIPSSGWPQSLEIPFNPIPNDSILDQYSHDLILIIRHNDSMPFDTIWIAVNESSFGTTIHSDTIPIKLSQPSGKWIGAGSHGLYEIKQPLHAFKKLPAGYEISLSHAMNKDPLTGIKNIGLIIRRRK